MTVLEFEAWVSDNYGELAAIAARVTKHSVSAVDSLHQIIEDLIESPEKLATLSGDLSPWFNRAIHLAHLEGLRTSVLHDRLEQELASDMRVLGEDAFVDAKAANANRRRARHEAGTKRITVNGKRIRVQCPTPSVSTEVEWAGPMPGTARWRYQQLRDNRLFDERAIRSLADSMHRASARYRHDGEYGFSFTEFGAECGHRSTQEVAR